MTLSRPRSRKPFAAISRRFPASWPGRKTLASAAGRYACGPRCSALTDERFLRAHYAELVSLRVGQDSPGLSAGLPDVGPARPECKKAINLLITVRGAAGEVEVHTVLDGLEIGDRHEADAHGRVLISPDDDLALALGQNLPAKRLRPDPGQAGRERQRRCGGVGQASRQYARHAGLHSPDPHSSAAPRASGQRP